jgi:hypothetical protein
MKEQNPTDVNPFGALLALQNDEELIRLRRRATNAGDKRLAEILSDEIQEREAIEKRINQIL